MSTLWTPGGERPVGRSGESKPPPPPTEPPPSAPQMEGEPSEAELRAHMEELRAQLLHTPAAVVIANHAFGLFELAALHLSNQPPNLEQARLSIDAFGALVEGLQGRLGDQEGQLVEGLAQLRLAFVQINAAAQAGQPPQDAPG